MTCTHADIFIFGCFSRNYHVNCKLFVLCSVRVDSGQALPKYTSLVQRCCVICREVKSKYQFMGLRLAAIRVVGADSMLPYVCSALNILSPSVLSRITFSDWLRYSLCCLYKWSLHYGLRHSLFKQ